VSGCTIAADGTSRRCSKRIKTPGGKSQKVSNRRRGSAPIDLATVLPGPIQHADIPERLIGPVRWTYDVVGHLLMPTLEQWETGFMRDLNIEGQVAVWTCAAGGVIAFHRRHGLPLEPREDDLRLALDLIAAGVGNHRTFSNAAI
jgi:hypothetical protein